MTIIGRVYQTETHKSGLKVHNVPYRKHDYPCYEGCCQNMLSIGAGIISKVSWLFNTYLPQNQLQEFDFNEWTAEQNEEWKKSI